MARAIFLDQDGALIENFPHNVDLELVRLRRGVIAGLQMLAAAGFEIHVVTHQPGIAQGLFSETARTLVEERISELLRVGGIEISGFHCCSHLDKRCLCRLNSTRKLRISFRDSWWIGNTLDEVELAYRAKLHAILLNDGSETGWLFAPNRLPSYFASDLVDAAKAILEYQLRSLHPQTQRKPA